jgi:hypothetical protein
VLLPLGLKFIPTPSSSSVASHLRQSWLSFKRQLTNRIYFLEQFDHNNAQPAEHNRLVFKRNRTLAPVFSPSLALYLRRTEQLLFRSIDNQLRSSSSSRSNLPSSAVASLRQLLHDPNVLIKHSDKNLGLCLVSRAWYEEQAEQHLSDATSYTRVSREDMNTALSHYLTQIRDLIRNTDDSVLLPNEKKWIAQQLPADSTECCPAFFYLLPKLHKSPVSSRPIVSCIRSVTSPVSVLLDHLLQPLVQQLPTVIKDSRQLVQLLEHTTFDKNDDIVLLTSDISSLFTAIPLDQGIELVRSLLLDHDVPEPRATVLIRLLHLVLHHNFFAFGEDIYHQIKGTAMGSSVSVCFANTDVFYNFDRVVLQLALCLLFSRFLDDVFAVVKRKHLDQLLKLMKNAAPHLVFNTEWSDTSVNFMDLQIYKGERWAKEGRLDVRVFQKPVNRYLYLPPSSCHPPHVFRAWIRAELIRYIRNTSSRSEYVKIKMQFFVRLLHRGYTLGLLVPVMKSVRYDQRDSLLFPSSSSSAAAAPATKHVSNNTVLFPLLHSPFSSRIPIQVILNFERTALQEEWGDATPAIRTVSCTAPNIGQITVRAQYLNKPAAEACRDDNSAPA